ncbi:MAG: UvrD-helicase domain-containing protein [Prevotella sp.]|nr:UvrD-helicase domain-containing protein [Prevotella sp.]
MSKLKVYKASAGSGKTFRLAVEFIKLLITDPTDYRHILAVTFTNKATEEMKTRILSQLYGIWKRLPDSQPYLACVTSELQVSESYASQRAALALSNLIHHYSYFRVETIDAFFQSVLRNLARELELTANLRIALNDEQVEEKAVDELIDSLQKNSIELAWIMEYIQQNIDDDKSWNVIGQIKKFGRHIFGDTYKAHGEQLNAVIHKKDFFVQFTKQLRQIRQDALSSMQGYAQKFFALLDQHGLSESDFLHGKSGVYGYFVKLRDGKLTDDIKGKRVEDALEDPMKWVKTADRTADSPILNLVQTQLHQLLIDAESDRPEQMKLYLSATLTSKHLSQLRLLSSIADKFYELNSHSNRFMLSDTQSLLHDLIADSDSPFIFEKIGSQLRHIMIDEFQDTSTIQWKNFKVLLSECLSHEDSQSLIVGDVKQSIYRWRSGDWRLLNDIEQEFHPSQIQIEPLAVNRRSARRIIEFNNHFFTEASSIEYNSLNEENPLEAPQMHKAYGDVTQIIEEEKPDDGFVSIELLPKNDYQQQTLQRLDDTITQMLQQGVQPHEMAILVRTNPLIQLIAQHLTKTLPDVKLVSDEAFRLDASTSVRIMVQAMQSLATPDDLLVRAALAKNYQRAIVGNHEDIDMLLSDAEQIDQFLPQSFTSRADHLLTLPLFELIQDVFSSFNLSKLEDESSYVCAFFDQVSLFLADNAADIHSFLDVWENDIRKKTIQSEAADGIRLLTIHKSKGLEFQHVLMPFCDWQLEKSDLLWCTPPEDAYPFCQLPLAPVDFSASQMKGTIYEPHYQHEHLQNVVDNLNLLYVAFTRAKSSLTVFGLRKNTVGRSLLIENTLPDIVNHLAGASLLTSDKEDESIIFTYGELKPTAQREQRKTDNVFLQTPASIRLKVESFPNLTVFRQSNKSRDFIEEKDDSDHDSSYIRLGNILHSIFSTIRTRDDIPAALSELESDGILYDDDISRQKLVRMIEQRLNSPAVSSWFSDRWKVFNECSILCPDPTTGEISVYRPDRVMADDHEVVVVDFKFGAPRPGYEEQVRGYMSLLHDMGHSAVRGFLWYVYSNQIAEVK